MHNNEYLKKIAATLIGAMITVPSIATGYYTIYMIVTAVGN